MSKNRANNPSKRPRFRTFFAIATAGSALMAFSGCEKADPPPEEATIVNENGETVPAGTEEVIQDTAYIVTEKRMAGGQLVEDTGNISSFDGKPRMKRVPVEYMIIVRGDKTGQESAYLLPAGDYNVVHEGHRLQKSTLGRWESTSTDHIPPPPPPPESGSNRSRAGGADGAIIY